MPLICVSEPGSIGSGNGLSPVRCETVTGTNAVVLDTYTTHYNDIITSAMASQITSLAIVYSTVYLRCRWQKTSKLRVTGLCVGNSPVTSPRKGPVMRKCFHLMTPLWYFSEIGIKVYEVLFMKTHVNVFFEMVAIFPRGIWVRCEKGSYQQGSLLLHGLHICQRQHSIEFVQVSHITGVADQFNVSRHTPKVVVIMI